MNRKHKFRVWDIYAKEWANDAYLMQSGELYFSGVIFLPDNFNIEKCTGICDMHSDDIYEGEILKIDDDDNDLVVVEFYKGMFGWWNLVMGEGYKDFTVLSAWPKILIMGNIHENLD